MFKLKSNAPAGSAEETSQSRSVWEKVLSMTPVLMTIVATLLAGLSTSAMTQAQYHRSLAAQNQSKVGDQWAFFQAKRIRGTTLEMTVKLLHAVSEPQTIEPASLQSASDRLAAGLARCEKDAKQLLEKIRALKPALGSPEQELQVEAERLWLDAQGKVKKAEDLRARLGQKLSDKEVTVALAYLTSNKLPPIPVDRGRAQAVEDPAIREALAEIAQRKPEKETEAAVATVTEAALRQALLDAEDQARAFDEAGKPVSDRCGAIETVVKEESALARSFYRATRNFLTLLDDLSKPESSALTQIRAAFTPLGERAAALKNSTNELNNDFTADQLYYSARRYAREARDNQALAGLYEIQVRKSSWDAERHRLRSKYFFFGMLAAQAGVTIASLALAVRQKSVLWGLAGAAGVIALIIGGYVYLYI